MRDINVTLRFEKDEAADKFMALITGRETEDVLLTIEDAVNERLGVESFEDGARVMGTEEDEGLDIHISRGP